MYKTNHILYSGLALIFLLLTEIVFVFGPDGRGLSMVGNIFCGCFSSVVCAWLIDISNCAIRQKEYLGKQRAIWDNFALSILLAEEMFSELDFVLFDRIREIDKKTTSVQSQKHLFDYWNDILWDEKKYLHIDNLVIGAIKSILESIKEIENNRIALLNYDLVSATDFYHFQEVKMGLTKLQAWLEDAIRCNNSEIIHRELKSLIYQLDMIHHQWPKLETIIKPRR